MLACAASITAGFYLEAARYSSLALEYTHRSGGVTQAIHSVEWAAQSLAGLERWEAAASLWGYVMATRQRLGSIEPPLIHRLQAPLVAALQAHVGAERLRSVQDASSLLTLDDIVRFARSELGD